MRGWVTGVDAAARTVRIDDERILEYDLLVYALGGAPDTTGVPGVDAHAYTLDQRGRRAVAGPAAGRAGRRHGGGVRHRADRGGGGGRDRRAAPALEVVLLGRAEPGAAMGPRARAYLRRGAGAARCPGAQRRARSSRCCPDRCSWPAATRSAPTRCCGRPACGCPRWRPAPDWRSTSAAGSSPTPPCARCPTPRCTPSATRPPSGRASGCMHGTCQSGMPTGVHVAASIARQLAGGQPRPFRFGYLHQPVSLGRHDAVIQFTHPDDSPRRWFLTGRAAVWYKETVSSAPWPTYAPTDQASRRWAPLGWRRRRQVHPVSDALRRAPEPALRGRLPDPRQRGRRRGRRAGHLAEVVGGGPLAGHRPEGVPGADRVQRGAGPAARGPGAGARPTSARGCPSRS